MNRREQVEKYIIDLMKQIDEFGSNNAGRYIKMFSAMTDDDFDRFMKALRDGHTQINTILPNNIAHINTNKVIDLAKKRKVPIFERITFSDMHTGRLYKTRYEMMVLTLPVRRLSQYLFHKISLPESDAHINPVTGQVIPPDKGAALSAIETQVLASKGLEASVIELLKIRAGDINAYQSMKYSIEENGEVSMADIPLTGRPRSVITTQRYLHAMGIESSL